MSFKVSIIVPVFNRGNLISETLVSVLDQSHKNWECLIIDDGSFDKTPEIVHRFCQRDSRIKFFLRPQDKVRGASSCRNFGLDLAQGDFIQFLDSDDLLEKNKLEAQLEALLKAPPCSIATCKFGSFSSSSLLQVKTQYNSYKTFCNSLELLYTFGRYNEYFPPHVYLIPRELINRTEGWNEELSYNDDGEYFTRILIQSSQVLFCGSTEVYYRAGDQNRLSILNSDGKLKSAIESWRLIEEHLIDISPKICSKYVRNGRKNIKEQVKGIDSLNNKYREPDRMTKTWIQNIINRIK